jgi:hypothetical protein
MNHDLKSKTDKIKKNIKPNIIDLIQEEQYVGEVVNLVFGSAKVQVNDAYRRRAGGIPAQCFLIATRINKPDFMVKTKDEIEELYEEEDCSVILLRVIDSANLPGDIDKERILVENAERAHGEDAHWDSSLQDPSTKKLMSFGALQCRVIGTFYMESNSNNKYSLKFGNDLSNFYPNRGLKVYKPSATALSAIVNFGVDYANSVKVGQVRYSSTNRKWRSVSEVEVDIDPRDLIAQKTAVFGMTRTGKSNTVKIIAKSIYQLRQKVNQKIGQLIFDANGEYANENLQDINSEGEAQALRNVWKVPVDGEMGSPDDVITYGLLKNANDPNRIVMKINFYDDKLIQVGKELIDDKLSSDPNQSVQYIKSFTSVYFEPLESLSFGEISRERRRRLIYKTILHLSGFKDPTEGKALKENKKLFNEDIIGALEVGIKDYDDLNENKQKEMSNNLSKYREAAAIFERFNNFGTSYAELGRAFEALLAFTKDPYSTYNDFERGYLLTSDSGSIWLDVNTSSLLETFQYKNAAKKIAKASVYHDPKSSKKDYAQMIYDDLAVGKLVIVDQALGDSDLNKLAAERILRKIFEENNKLFSEAENPSNILIYVEEAHNLMPRGSEEDTTNIWARVAKEGAKFNIGMIYSTQEVSSIQKNILKNTTTWFISHLNNKEEIRALSDFYDFSDFAASILQAEDKGFIRMKTKSNKFVVPIQVDKFEINENVNKDSLDN